ncbi:nitrogenase molybdenum-iron protein NifN [Syntrophus gentianae]|uniref:Nitrogenase molybdenum-iron protein NifN n=1 Tax=Syntrophus gentianae TaxID=43775 RepID=A0A1H7YTW7_9BACT|nr:nitrogenase component 1 [Syntrophus gentianae]SEM49393.1 nitrogenase molybdenum-iron protein NifN [Syntrophus gentianae]
MKNADVLPFRGKEDPSFVSTRNACKLCAPLGAGIAFRGIEGCIPLIHGSQGCSTYIRRYVISHFREPIDIASSNFSETSAIFGGGDNLKKALDNVIRQYNPTAVGIATTCLSETIGDDIRLYLDQYRAERRDVALPALLSASTPSYRGTHMDGYSAALKATVAGLAEKGEGQDRINLLPGFLSPADLRSIKEILSDFGMAYTMLPDYSETLDGQSWSEYQKLAPGGTTIEAIQKMGSARETLQLGRSLADQDTAATFLKSEFGVPVRTLGYPVGIRETDRFFSELKALSGSDIPGKYSRERGRLVDSYIDGHKYAFGKRAVLYGEMDLVVSLASFLDEIGMDPVLCATGAASERFKELVTAVLEHPSPDLLVLEDSDFATLRERCRSLRPDVILGNSKGYPLARELGIPLVRAGFPIHDRIGAQRIRIAGYEGTQQLYDRIVNALLEHRQEESPVGYSYM